MSRPIYYLGAVLICCLSSACGVTSTWYSKPEENWKQKPVPDSTKLLHAVYLIGDAGEPGRENLKASLKLLEQKLKLDSAALPGREQTLLFLGDNIYERGLPPEDHNGRDDAEHRLTMQLDIVKKHPGKKIMIPGNHDWNVMMEGGWEYIVRQQEFVEQYLHDSTTYYPKGGCPGPVEVSLGHNIVLIIIDSEWWLHRYDKPYGVLNPCDVQDEFDFIVQVQNAVKRHRNKHILLAMHHPLYSNGNHGGYFSLKDYIFPLTLLKDDLYIPLPVIGSLYPFMRKYGFSRQDIPNPVYQKFRAAMMSALEGQDKLIIASGHDHNLQLHQLGDIHQLVSGSAVKKNHVVRGNNATFIAKENGFSVVNYYDNGQAWVEFWVPDDEQPEGRLLYRKSLYAITPEEAPAHAPIEVPDYRDSTIVKPAALDYNTNFISKWLFGTTYRAEWATPVKLRYLDMKTEAGGLTPIKRGGGMQTLSLRLKGADGNQYTLRSVNKDPAAIIPKGLRETFVDDMVKDQMSSSHPYGALAIPKLADAIGVYHTKPKFFYIPNTPQLGEFMDEFGGSIAMLEIRPDEDLSEFRNFGRSENVVSTTTMFEKLREDNDNAIDAKDYLRARYLDLIINDWDRHPDQWRWAEFEKNKGDLFRPIPRDRDQAFAMYNGLMPQLVASRFFSREISPFTYKIHDIIGQTISALAMDRRLLNPLEKKDWLKEAEDVQKNMTDAVIEAAVKDLPGEVYDISGEEIIAKVKQRRNDLKTYAEAFYLLMAEKADITLSDKHEYVEVARRENGDTEVKVWKRDIDGKKEKIEQKIYERDFKHDETREIRIYCLGGRDSVIVKGRAGRGIVVRVIGGPGKDYIHDASHVSGWRDHTKIYDYNDVIEQNTFSTNREATVHTSRKAWINNYDPDDFRYSIGKPLAFLSYDIDYGIFPGAGLKYYKYGFRTHPYASMHMVRASRSLSTSSFNVEFEADYPVAFGQHTGLNARFSMNAPDYVINYFGQGNESEFAGDNIYPYRVALNYYHGTMKLAHRISDHIQFQAGPLVEYAAVATAGTGIENTVNEQNRFFFTGATASFNVDYTSGRGLTTRGIAWNNELSFRTGDRVAKQTFGKYTGNATFYVTPNTPMKITFAFRLGGEIIVGDYPFYHAAFMGGNTNLRGFRSYRFAGRNSFYQNTEARLTFSRLRSYVLSGSWGPFGFIDHGRVWADDESSRRWHFGYGGGLWMRAYDLVTLSAGIGFSEEGRYFRINGGFFF